MDDQFATQGVEAVEPPPVPPTGEVGQVRADNQRIGVGSGDENVAKIQLAARWAEAYVPSDGDSLEGVLQRFHRAYAYIDSVTLSVVPEEP